MTTRKTITLDDLDRDELLQLVRSSGIFLIAKSDLVWAQWEVATRREKEIRDRVFAMYEANRPLLEAYMDAMSAMSKAPVEKLKGALKQFDRANAAYKAAVAQQEKLDAKADGYRRRADRLYKIHQDLQGELL